MKLLNWSAGLALLFFAPLAVAQTGEPVKKELPMQAQQAQEIVTKQLDKIGGLKSTPAITWLDDASLKEVFPTLTFFSVRYRKYPITVAPPEGLSATNVFAVDKDGKWKTLTSPDDVSQFFLPHYLATKAKATEKNTPAVAKAWLNLTQELVQDGFYSFEIVKAEAKKDATNTIVVVGKSMVTKGGNGEIEVFLEFPADGSLKAKDMHKLIPGPRPKCQATKLLDLDPLVRSMAESELLFMGVAAKPYLLEQRARAANPQLAAVIDRLLQRIEVAGW